MDEYTQRQALGNKEIERRATLLGLVATRWGKPGTGYTIIRFHIGERCVGEVVPSAAYGFMTGWAAHATEAKRR